MRLLLDECVPRGLRQHLPNHHVRTVPQMGWAGKQNGELLALAEAAFDVFVTVDHKLKYQQAVAGRDIAVVILVAKRNKIDFLRPLVPQLERTLLEVKPGELREVGAP